MGYPRWAVGFGLCAVSILISSGALAQEDPRHSWLTLGTPHFEVHYHQGEYALAAKIARMGELAHAKLEPLLEHEPAERCQIVVSDDTDFANGNATPLLYNTIHAYAPPPDPRSSLNDFDDYLWELISHEYTHILHLDTVLGLPAAVNDIFGKLWIPNGGQPAWFIEGLAVYQESEVSASGRVRSSQEEMAVRAEALERHFPDIDNLSNLPLDWPRGASWYDIGGRFIDWIGHQYGAGALRDLSHDFGGRAIPLGLNLSAETVLGPSYLTLYKEFVADETARARATADQVRSAGETLPEPLTRLGEIVGSPRFSKDGSTLFYASDGADRLPELRSLPLLPLDPCCVPDSSFKGQTRPGDDRIAQSYGENRLAVSPRGRIVFSRVEVFQQFADIEDLYAVDADGSHETRVTRGLRATEPDVAPDGAIVFSQRLPGGRTAISLLAPGAAEPRILFTDSTDGQPVASPRFSPDGREVAFLQHRSGTWNLNLVSREGAAQGVTELMHDRAIERDPSFSPDGAYLLFSSDRSGIFDIYALRLADHALFRVTHMLEGAFEPEVSPDQTQLALVTYSARGYDLGRIPYQPEFWTLERGPSHQDLILPPVSLEPAAELFPVSPYNPLPTLRPHYWLPYVGVDAAGTTLGALTSGSDVVGRNEYAGTVWYGLGSKTPGWDLSYTNHTLYPDINLYTFRDLVVPAGLPDNTERHLSAGVFASFPFSAFERSFSLGAGYELSRLSKVADPFHLAAADGTLAAGQIRLAYSDAKRFIRSISTEQGQRASITLRVADPALGSDFAFRQLSGAASKYLPMPWTWNGRPLHHVLAARLSGGIARGDLARRHLWELGGFDEGDPIQSILNPTGAPITILRGFRGSSFYGDVFALGSLEYRFPIVSVETGAWTLPLYLRRIHGAVFVDAGDAWNAFAEKGTSLFLAPNRFQLHESLGAEVRFETVLGYVLPTDVRVGCARGLEHSEFAILDCYFALGGVY